MSLFSLCIWEKDKFYHRLTGNCAAVQASHNLRPQAWSSGAGRATEATLTHVRRDEQDEGGRGLGSSGWGAGQVAYQVLGSSAVGVARERGGQPPRRAEALRGLRGGGPHEPGTWPGPSGAGVWGAGLCPEAALAAPEALSHFLPFPRLLSVISFGELFEEKGKL